MPEKKNNSLENLQKKEITKLPIDSKDIEQIPQTKEQRKNLERATEGQQTKEKSKPSFQPISTSQKTDVSKIKLEPGFKAIRKEVENILEAGLENLYLDMSKEKQIEFKANGEETVNKISQLLMQAKIQVKKIVQAIIDWLKIIPGINKFFIRQTAKIKTDKILKLKLKQNKK